MERRNTTIHDLAAALGVTASTVSRAMADHPRISQVTKERVLEMARQMNYQPNKRAAQLRQGRGNSIGVIVPRINRSFFSNVIAGMESVTNPAGYTLMICQTNEDAEAEVRAVESFLNNQVDGILMSLSAGTVNMDHLVQVLRKGIRMVQFDRVSHELDVNRVVNNNVNGAYMVTKYLLEKGHRQLVHFSGPMHINIYRERLEGFKRAIQEFGHTSAELDVFENVLTRDEGASALDKILCREIIPDAIFCASDFSALGVQMALQSKRALTQKEIEVAGFGNEPFTGLMQPGLTSVEQNGIRMGQEAARMLIESIETADEVEKAREIIIETELIER